MCDTEGMTSHSFPPGSPKPKSWVLSSEKNCDSHVFRITEKLSFNYICKSKHMYYFNHYNLKNTRNFWYDICNVEYEIGISLSVLHTLQSCHTIFRTFFPVFSCLFFSLTFLTFSWLWQPWHLKVTEWIFQLLFLL